MTPTKSKITNHNYNGKADRNCPRCNSSVIYKVETAIPRKNASLKVIQGYFCQDCLSEYDNEWNYLQPLK